MLHKLTFAAVGSMTSKDLEANGIYQGGPACKIRERIIEK